MLVIDVQKRKLIEEEIKDMDEDEIQALPVINEQAIRQLIRKLESGQSVEIFQPMRVGGYRKDIVQAILKHEYSSMEDIFPLMEKLIHCDIDFTKVLLEQTSAATRALSDHMTSAQRSATIQNPVALRERHFTFIANLKIAGFDERNKVFLPGVLIWTQEVLKICKQVETASIQTVTLTSLRDGFPFNMLDYVKSVETILNLVLDALFGWNGCETPVLQDVSTEDVIEFITKGKEIPLNLPKQDLKAFAVAFFKDLRLLIPTLFSSFSILNSGVQAQIRGMRRMNEAKKKELCDLLRHTSFLAQALNNTFENFMYQKQLPCTPVLSDIEEMQLVDMMDGAQTSALQKRQSDIYKVMQIIENEVESQPLMSSNSCQIELEFHYPSEFFKHNIEELPNLKIKRQLELLTKLDLVKYFNKLIGQCESFDDVEYFAMQLITQRDEFFEYDLSQQIGRLWFYESNLKNVVHLVATLYYNGIKLYHIDNKKRPTSEDLEKYLEELPDMCEYCLHQTMAIISVMEAQSLCWTIRELLFYRLIPVSKILELDQELIKLIAAYSSKSYAQLGVLVQYFTTLVTVTIDYATLFDETYNEELQNQLPKPIQAMKNFKFKNDDEQFYVSQLRISIESTALDLQKRDKDVSNEGQNIQKRLEEAAAKLKMLREKNPKQYKRELEKARFLEEKKRLALEEEQKKEVERLAKRKPQEPEFDSVIVIYEQALITGEWEPVIKAIDKYVTNMAVFEEKKKQTSYEDQVESGEGKQVKAYIAKSKDEIRQKALKKLVELFQNSITLDSLDKSVAFWNALTGNMILKMYVSKLNYEDNIWASIKTDPKTLLVKLVLYTFDPVLYKSNMLKTATELCNSIVFESCFDYSCDLQQTVVRICKLRAVSENEDLEFKANYMMRAGQLLGDERTIFTGLVCYSSLEDQSQGVAEYEAITSAHDIEKLIKAGKIDAGQIKKKVELKAIQKVDCTAFFDLMDL